MRVLLPDVLRRERWRLHLHFVRSRLNFRQRQLRDDGGPDDNHNLQLQHDDHNHGYSRLRREV